MWRAGGRVRRFPSPRSGSSHVFSRGVIQIAFHHCHACFRIWPLQEGSGKRGTGPASQLYLRGAVSRAPPAFLPYLRGRSVFTARLVLRAHHPARHLRVPNQRRPLHAHPVHDPCSREGDGPSIREAATVLVKSGPTIFKIECDQWLGGWRGEIPFTYGQSRIAGRENQLAAGSPPAAFAAFSAASSSASFFSRARRSRSRLRSIMRADQMEIS
jgi:hypothetical protein